jgi:hypothetical protein
MKWRADCISIFAGDHVLNHLRQILLIHVVLSDGHGVFQVQNLWKRAPILTATDQTTTFTPPEETSVPCATNPGEQRQPPQLPARFQWVYLPASGSGKFPSTKAAAKQRDNITTNNGPHSVLKCPDQPKIFRSTRPQLGQTHPD